MAITRGFGFSINLETGVSTPFAFRSDGLKQEDFNSMMRHPGEVRRVEVQMNSCPNCGERYCGDGVESCTECATPNLDLDTTLGA
jgi:hypothetical protein